jgi:hypothetical protein
MTSSGDDVRGVFTGWQGWQTVSNSGQQPSFAGQLQASYRGAKTLQKGQLHKKNKKKRKGKKKKKKKKIINKKNRKERTFLNHDTCKKCPTPQQVQLINRPQVLNSPQQLIFQLEIFQLEIFQLKNYQQEILSTRNFTT